MGEFVLNFTELAKLSLIEFCDVCRENGTLTADDWIDWIIAFISTFESFLRVVTWLILIVWILIFWWFFGKTALFFNDDVWLISDKNLLLFIWIGAKISSFWGSVFTLAARLVAGWLGTTLVALHKEEEKWLDDDEIEACFVNDKGSWLVEDGEEPNLLI